MDGDDAGAWPGGGEVLSARRGILDGRRDVGVLVVRGGFIEQADADVILCHGAPISCQLLLPRQGRRM